MDSKDINISDLLKAQQEVLSKITLDRPLKECLEAICTLIESALNDSNAACSILLLQNQQLWHGGSSSLPQAYCEAIDGVEIGDGVGSCGTAAFTKQQVIVEDIENDPLWVNFKDIALSHNLRACWSTPILSSKQEVLGTFAIYYAEKKAPESFHFDLIDQFTQLSSLAIEKAKSYDREAKLLSELKHSHEKFTAFTSVMPDLAIILNEHGVYVDVHGANESARKLIGKEIYDTLPPDTAKDIANAIQKALGSDQVIMHEYQLSLPRGRCVFEARIAPIKHYLPDTPEIGHVVWMERDITERKRTEHQIQEMAFTDPLTTLPNRRLLMDRLQSLIDKVKRYENFGALLYLDLDGFKQVNDALGHSFGDRLLVEVTKRLKPILRNSDTFARLGGDEFVILLESLENNRDAMRQDAANVAQKLISCFEQPFVIDAKQSEIGISIGISLVEGKTITTDEILKKADSAMYRSKKYGGNQFTFFEP